MCTDRGSGHLWGGGGVYPDIPIWADTPRYTPPGRQPPVARHPQADTLLYTTHTPLYHTPPPCEQND